MCEIREEDRIITPGPAGFLPLSAAQLGVSLSDPGEGIYYGHHVDEDKVMEEAATRMLTEQNATIFPTTHTAYPTPTTPPLIDILKSNNIKHIKDAIGKSV